jgi:hypothetical protein
MGTYDRWKFSLELPISMVSQITRTRVLTRGDGKLRFGEAYLRATGKFTMTEVYYNAS